jgi:hypothetical protein
VHVSFTTAEGREVVDAGTVKMSGRWERPDPETATTPAIPTPREADVDQPQLRTLGRWGVALLVGTLPADRPSQVAFTLSMGPTAAPAQRSDSAEIANLAVYAADTLDLTLLTSTRSDLARPLTFEITLPREGLYRAWLNLGQGERSGPAGFTLRAVAEAGKPAP